MYKQTIDLCSSLPHFAELFKAADRIGSAEWQIIQWENIDTDKVRPDQVNVISVQRFSSRTEALRKSWELVKPLYRNEKTHLGVLEWQENGKTVYQSVMPLLRYNADAQNRSGRPDAVKENTEAPASTMVRISEKANLILRRISDEDGKTLQGVLDEAMQEFDKLRFFRDLNAFYTELRNDPEAWNEEMEERALWESTLMDGLDTDEVWDLETRTATIKGQENRCG